MRIIDLVFSPAAGALSVMNQASKRSNPSDLDLTGRVQKAAGFLYSFFRSRIDNAVKDALAGRKFLSASYETQKYVIRMSGLLLNDSFSNKEGLRELLERQPRIVIRCVRELKRLREESDTERTNCILAICGIKKSGHIDQEQADELIKAVQDPKVLDVKKAMGAKVRELKLEKHFSYWIEQQTSPSSPDILSYPNMRMN